MRRRAGTLAALVIGLAIAPASGQDARAWRDSSKRVWATIRVLRDSLVQLDSTATEVARRGNLVMTASENQRSNALRAFPAFTRVTEPFFGRSLPVGGGFRIVLRTSTGEAFAWGESHEVGTVVLAGMPDTGNTIRTQRTVSPGDLTNALIDRYGEMMIANGPSALSNWIENPPPLSMTVAERRMLAMYAFVTGTGRVQRACVGANYAACKVALDLHHSPSTGDGPVFYTPFMRMDLLLFTLELGGAGAWERFQGAASEGLEPALAAAAAMPIDSVLARWRRGLLSVRPAEGPVDKRAALTVIAWGAIVLAGTLGASRWV